MFERPFGSSSSPVVVSRVQASPLQPRPNRTSISRAADSGISNAIEGLEDIVQEAVDLAERTEDRRQVEEIYGIIEDVKAAMLATTEPPVTNVTSLPLVVSSSSEEVENRRLPVPDVHNALRKESVYHDWAYPLENKDPPRTHSPSFSSDNAGQDHPDFIAQRDLLLPPPPPPAQPISRDHVDFVLRPITHDGSRGRSPQRRDDDFAGGMPRHRHRRDSGHGSRSRRQQQMSSGFGHSDSCFDDEQLPSKPYGNELTVRDQAHNHTLNVRRHHRRQPIARNWSTGKKRFTATIACVNTALLGIIVGLYVSGNPHVHPHMLKARPGRRSPGYTILSSGREPSRCGGQCCASTHQSPSDQVLTVTSLYFGLAMTTIIVWPLPLLHGRKPYLLASLALALPLQFPQAMVVSQTRSPKDMKYRTGLLCARAATGLVLGFANVNYITVLLDLFGASLQSKNPHQEFVVPNDIRRHGGGMGIWLGIWSWCWVASLAVGFLIGATVIESLTPDWGFYIVIFILVAALMLNIVAPETRRAAYRKSVTEVYDRDENYITRRVSRGECKLHISTEGPKYWFEEVWAGMKLVLMMMMQPGFFVLSLYVAWIYAEVVLVIILLGALLSRDYKWQPHYVGAGVVSIAIGALLAIPLTKARIFSRERKSAFRTDSMTFQKQVTWSSHLVRRALFTLTLPLMGLAYTVSSAGRPRPYMVPIVFAGALGFLSILAVAECHGLIMETFDTCDLQPGVNTRHRFESMAVQDRRRRTNYTSFPRVTAGIFASQTLAFVLAGIATLVGGNMTRRLGAQTSTGATAGILLGITVLLTLVLWRFKEVQVIPNHTFGTRRDTAAWDEFKDLEKMGRGSDWKAVVIGNPSGKMRKMSMLEFGALSRWTEIRKLNFLLKGRRLGEEAERSPSHRGDW
jgi:MFS family permease